MINNKGIAISTLGIIIILLITMLVAIFIIMGVNSEGTSLMDKFFGFLTS